MYCIECKSKIDDDSKYCDVCGKKVIKNSHKKKEVNKEDIVIRAICIISLIILLIITYKFMITHN